MIKAWYDFKRAMAQFLIELAASLDTQTKYDLLFDKHQARLNERVLRDIARGDITDKGEMQHAALKAII